MNWSSQNILNTSNSKCPFLSHFVHGFRIWKFAVVFMKFTCLQGLVDIPLYLCRIPKAISFHPPGCPSPPSLFLKDPAVIHSGFPAASLSPISFSSFFLLIGAGDIWGSSIPFRGTHPSQTEPDALEQTMPSTGRCVPHIRFHACPHHPETARFLRTRILSSFFFYPWPFGQCLAQRGYPTNILALLVPFRML